MKFMMLLYWYMEKRMGDLATWLERKNMLQKELAAKVGVRPSAVSKWKKKGIPSKRLEDVSDALGIEVDDLTPDRAGEYVGQQKPDRIAEALNDWHTEVSASDLEPKTKAILGSFPNFIDKISWVCVFRTEDLVNDTGWPEDEVRDRWDDILDSPYVERVGQKDVQWVFRLKFPEEK